MTEQTAITAQPEPLALYIRKPEIIEKFALVLGNNREAMRFVQSVILAVETADPGEYSLLNCSPRSVVRSALRAATQRVSVDPLDRQAFLIPRNNRKTGKQEATFQLHYNEVYNRAMRTNRYQFINVSPIYAGTTIYENVYTGLHVIELEGGLQIDNKSAPVLRKWGEDDGKERIGWLGYYKTIRGQEKTIYMTIKEIEKVASTNTGWQKSFGWTKYRETMEKKTVLLALLRTADLSAPGMEEVKNALSEIDNAETEHTDDGPDLESLAEHDADVIDGVTSEAEPVQSEQKPSEINPEEAAYIAAKEVQTPGKKFVWQLPDEQLIECLKYSEKHPDVAKAATAIIAWRAIMKKSEEAKLKELGF